MEKQGTKRTTRRKLGLKIGDYVVQLKDTYWSLDPDGCYCISRFVGDSYFCVKNIGEWFYNKSNFRKSTDQEYIVAKLKGKLYE